MAQDIVERIEGRIDRTEFSGTEVSGSVGGVAFENYLQVMEFAKSMATGTISVPKHLRGHVGDCLAVTVQAIEWRMSPFAVANKSYSVNDRLAFESQLIHAVVNSRAPLQKRLRATFEGEGGDLQCTITGYLEGEDEPFEYTSPKVGTIKVKNSPLWVADPQQQLWYYSTRAWARRWVPEVLLGIYARDEIFEEEGEPQIKDVTPKPKIAERLTGPKAEDRGFDHGQIEVIAKDAAEQADTTSKKPDGEGSAGQDTEKGVASKVTDEATRPDEGKDGPNGLPPVIVLARELHEACGTTGNAERLMKQWSRFEADVRAFEPESDRDLLMTIYESHHTRVFQQDSKAAAKGVAALKKLEKMHGV